MDGWRNVGWKNRGIKAWRDRSGHSSVFVDSCKGSGLLYLNLYFILVRLINQ